MRNLPWKSLVRASSRLVDTMDTRLIVAACTGSAHRNTGATFLVMRARQGSIFQERKAGDGPLLFRCILLAGLLALKDGVLALHHGPAHRTVGQIPDDPRQLADLRRENTSVCLTAPL